MTISSPTSTSAYSPLDLLKQELAKEVSAGTVGSSDQSALTSALDDIDSALKGTSSSSSSSTSAPASPQQLPSKIDDLIQSEVSNGKLTSDQATELKSVFANAFSGHAHRAGGPPPSGLGSDHASSEDTSSASSSTDTTALLKQLLSVLQSSNGQSASSYGANGTTSSSATSTSLLLNYTT
jgi:hypothetical protein